MRLLKLSTSPSTYLNQLYSRKPGLATQPYPVQHKALMSDCVGWADFWSVALRNIGYEVEELVGNSEPMQKRWAEEKGLTIDEKSWLFQIVAAQVSDFRPEVLFVQDYSTFSASFLRKLRSECDSIKLIVGWCGAQYNDATVFREYDIVLSCVPELVRHFRDGGHSAHHINHAFEPIILERIDLNNKPSVDFAFIGSLVIKDQFHRVREKLLAELAKRTDLQIWSDFIQPSWRERLGGLMRRFAYDAVRTSQYMRVPERLLRTMPIAAKVVEWDSPPQLPPAVDPDIARRAHPPLFGLAMYQQLRDSKVSLNTHIDLATESASNMRLYEATGVGACLLTDWKPNLSTLFEPDSEVVTYRGADECIEKLNYLLEHEKQRSEIARAGQQRTMREHTFSNRANELDDLIRKALRAK